MEQLTQIEWLKRRIADLQLPGGMPEDSAAPVAVKVNVLEWTVLDDEHWGATSLGLSYEIRKSQLTGSVRVRGSRNIHDGFMDFDGTVEEAKAAAQADFERRILSALSAAPVSAEPQLEPVDDTIIAWYGTNGAEWRRADGKSASYMIKPVMYVPAGASTPDLAAEIARLREATTWRPMSEAPTNGMHVLVAVKSDGGFVRTIEGACYDGKKWMNAADIDSEPLCWMPKTSIPDVFLPWTEEFFRARAALADQKGGEA